MSERAGLPGLLDSSASALELTGVSRRFGALAALSDVNMRIAVGERRAVLGSNGAGKTTLFNLITGDIAATTGRIRFFGEDVTTLPTHERIRLGLRRTYQISLLLNRLSVFDNVFLACRGTARRRFSLLRPRSNGAATEQALRILAAVRLEEVAGLDVAALSHGQQRQLEIGMALAGAPRFILFDEPAAGLSPSEREDLVAVLTALPPHIGYIIIEHDLDVALRVSTYVSMMHNGAIFKEGAPEEIENDPQVQEIYLGGQHG